MAFTVQFDSTGRFRRTVSKWMRHLSNLRWMWPAVADEVELHHAREVFDTEGPVHHRPWKPLAPATVSKRRYRVPIWTSESGAYGVASHQSPEHMILQWTGALRASLARRRARGAIRGFHGNWMEFGSGLSYASDHHYGGAKVMGGISEIGRRATTPARPILDPAGSLPAAIKGANRALGLMFKGTQRRTR